MSLRYNRAQNIFGSFKNTMSIQKLPRIVFLFLARAAIGQLSRHFFTEDTQAAKDRIISVKNGLGVWDW